ncbi:MAG: T9SS type A sorting domain-containing protein [bacterium]|nr:T9SS type A sorting domain-containing protein [bacterium]
MFTQSGINVVANTLSTKAVRGPRRTQKFAGFLLLCLLLMSGTVQAQGVLQLHPDPCHSTSVMPQMFKYWHQQTGWMGVAVAKQLPANDAFLRAWDNEFGSGSPIHSSNLPDATNFLIRNWSGDEDWGFCEVYTSGPYNGTHLTDYDPGQGAAVPDTEYNESYGGLGGGCGLFRVWDLYLVAGTSYRLHLSYDSPSTDYVSAALLRTGGVGGWLSRADAIEEYPAGEGMTLSYDFTAATSGTYALVLFHENYSTNGGDYTFQIEEIEITTGAPDLEIAYINPGSVPEGTPFDIKVFVRNNGSVDSEPCITSVSVDGSLLCPNLYTPAIAANGGVVEVTTCAAGPYGAGQIDVYACVDTFNTVPEGDYEGNNTKTESITITQVVSTIDLKIMSIEPAVIIPFRDVEFEITVANQGNTEAPASFTAFELNMESNPCGDIATPIIPAYGEVVVTCSTAGLVPGPYMVSARADVNDSIEETNATGTAEVNNEALYARQADGVEVHVTGFTPTEASAAEMLTFEITFNNSGNSLMPSSHASLEVDGISYGTIPVPAITPGVPLTVSSGPWSPLTPGHHSIEICADVNNVAEEYDEDNNCFTGTFLSRPMSTVVFADGHGHFATIQDAVDGVLDNGTILLAGGTYTGEGNRDIEFGGRDLSVIGLGDDPANAIIDCNGSSGDPHRAFLILNGSAAGSHLANFTITGGWTDDSAGAIGLDNVELTLEALVFEGNSANYSDGGAIASNHSRLTIEDCLFLDNAANKLTANDTFGGAIHFAGMSEDLYLKRSTFVGNSATNGASIFMQHGDAEIENCLFTGNSADQSCLDASSYGALSLECCDVWGNAGGDWVGAIAGQSGASGNISSDPRFCDPIGGDYTLHSDSPCAKDNNDCSRIGLYGVGCGAVGETVFLVNPDGSGDYSTIQLAMNACVDGDVIELGDGIFTGSGNRDLSFNGLEIIIRSVSGNRDDCVLDLEGSSSIPHRAFLFNNGEGSGAKLENFAIRNGWKGNGGALYLNGAVSPIFTNIKFEYCYAGTNGGAIYMDGGAQATFSECQFVANNANTDGGAFFGYYGGAQMRGCTFQFNHAVNDGGAVHIRHDDFTFESCTFSGNSAGNRGGSVYGYALSIASLFQECLFNNCSATNAGGALWVTNGYLNLFGCTLHENQAPEGGGVNVRNNVTYSLDHCLITSCWVGEGVYSEPGSNPDIECTNIWNNAGGDWIGDIASYAGVSGNLSVDPMYCNPGTLDFHLNLLSPCNGDINPCGQQGAFGIGCGIRTHLLEADGSGDYPTIQAAINACGWGDTIQLADGVYTGDGNRDLGFNFTSIYLRSASGNPEACIIDCNAGETDQHRGFTLGSSAECPQVTIEGITVRNAWKNYGGAMRIVGALPSITNCIFRDNISNNGAAIAMTSGSGPVITDCRFFDNSASNAGGALHCMSGAAPQVSDCVIENNYGHYGAGAVYVYAPAAPVFTDCIITGNSSNSMGGAVHCQYSGAEPVFTNCTFDSNHSPQGGVAYCRNEGNATFIRSILANSTEGSASVCVNSGSVSLEDSDVWNNSGGDWTGCLAGLEGEDGNFSADPLYCGPGLYTLHGESPCAPANSPGHELVGAGQVECSVLYVVKPDGSGDFPTIQAALDGTGDGDVIELADGVFRGTGNRDLLASGAAVSIRSQSGNAETCIIDCEGTAEDQHRGIKFYLGETSTTEFSDITIRNAYAWFAGGMFCEHESSPTIRGCIFEDNIVDSRGAAIAVHNASAPLIIDCIFRDNHASSDGGAIRCYFGYPTIENCIFTGNTTDNRGGAVMIYNYSFVTIRDCWFEDNHSAVGGGALHIEQGSTLKLYSATIANNTSAGTCGGISVIDSEYIKLYDSTVYGNTGVNACGVYVDGTPAQAEGMLFAFGNRAPAFECVNSGTATLTCCDIYGNAGGDWTGSIAGQYGVAGNISANPYFCDAHVGDFTIDTNSVCLAANNDCSEQIGAYGEGCSSVGVEDETAPTVSYLMPNVPNPFNPTTVISFGLAGDSQVDLRVFSLAGRLVRNLTQGRHFTAGHHSIIWDGCTDEGRRLASGVYLYRLQTADFRETRKMIMIK